MNKKSIIAIGLAASTIFSGLVARQVIGSQAADRCQTAVDSYSLLAEAQIKDMNSAKNMIEMIKENPFSAFMVGGELTRIGNQAKNRWEEINEASDLTYEVCGNQGFMATITDPYTNEAVGEMAQVEKNLEDTRQELVALTEAPSGPVARINGKAFEFTRMSEATWVVHNVNGESLTYQIGAPLYLGNGSVLITDGDGSTSGGTFQFTEGSDSFTITTARGNEIVIDLG